jgi:hypothetical protein
MFDSGEDAEILGPLGEAAVCRETEGRNQVCSAARQRGSIRSPGLVRQGLPDRMIHGRVTLQTGVTDDADDQRHIRAFLLGD